MAGNKGINPDGQHSVDSYQLGRGILKAALLDDDGKPMNYVDLGNIPDLTASVESEKLDHFTSRGGLRKIDKSVILSVTSSLSFSMEDITFENLGMFFSGSSAEYTNPAIAGIADAQFVEDGNVLVQTTYVLRTSEGEPIFGITATNSIVVESTGSTPVILTEDVDYTLNSVAGEIFLNETDLVLSIIDAGDGLQLSLTADPLATTVDELSILSETEVNVALRFNLEDADTGEMVIYDFYNTTLSANGDYTLIAEEWSTLPMTASIEDSTFYPTPGRVFYPSTQE